MARAATAYVEVRPDLTGFADELRTKLAVIAAPTMKIKVVADLRGFRKDLREKLKAMPTVDWRGVNVQPDMTLFWEDLQARVLAVRPVTVKVKVVPDMSGFRAALRREAQKIASEFILTENIQPIIEGRAARQFKLTAKNLARDTRIGMEREIAQVSKTFAGIFQPRFFARGVRGLVGGFGTAITDITKGIAKFGESTGKVFEQIGTVGLNAFANLGIGVTEFNKDAGVSIAGFGASFGKVFAQAGAGIASFAISLGEVAGPIGSIAETVAGILAGATAIAAAFAAVQTILGAIAIIVVPLVAAFYALAGAVAEVGAAAVGGIALLPGLLTTVGGAVGILSLAWAEFSKQLQQSGEGPLHDVVERLKLFVVQASGLDKLIKSFVTTTLPQFFGGIGKVAKAWGALFSSLATLVGTKAVVDAINRSFSFMAFAIGQASQFAKPLAQLFITLSETAQPAIFATLDALGRLVVNLNAMVQAASKSGDLTALFTQLSLILNGIVALVGPLTTLVSGFVKAALPSVIQFVGILGTLITRWSALINTPAGQNFIATFFATANAALVKFAPLIESIIVSVGTLGPRFVAALGVVVPILTTLNDVLVRMVVAAWPGLMRFLDAIAAVMKDKRVQDALVQLGRSIGDLVAAFATFDPKTAGDFLTSLVSLVQTSADLIVKLTPVITLTTTLMQLMVIYAPAAKVFADLIATLARHINELIAPLIGANGQLSALGHFMIPLPGIMSLLGVGVKSLGTSMGQVGAAATGMAGAFLGSLNSMQSGLSTFTGSLEQMLVLMQLGNLSIKDLMNPAKVKQIKAQVHAMLFPSVPKVTLPSIPVDVKAATTAAKPLTSAQQKALLQAIIPANMKGKAFDTAREVATYIAKGLVYGTAKVTKATANMLNNRTIKRALDALVTTIKKRDDVIARIKVQQKALADLLSAKAEFQKALTDTLSAGNNFVDAFKDFIPDPGDVADALQQSLFETRQFISLLSTLLQKGFSKEVVNQIAQAGVGGGLAVAQGLATSTPDQVNAINSTFKAIGDEAVNGAAAVANQMYDTGIAAVQGLIKGLASQQRDLDRQITGMVNSIVRLTKRLLGIKSPSSVFEDIGLDTGAGYEKGLLGSAGGIQSTLDMLGGLRPNFLPTGAYATGFSQQGINLAARIYVGDREITDIVKTEVGYADNRSAQALFYGRRFG